MGKKRKSIATTLDEVDRTMYASFSSAANSLSQLYSQGLNHQKLSFVAGERHGLEKLYQWILRTQEGGSRVLTVDILNYIQNELDYGGEDPSMSPRPPVQNQHSLSTMPFMSSSLSASSDPSYRPDQCDQQSKNSVFSNALSSPIRRSLQNYQIPQGGSSVNGGSLPGTAAARRIDHNTTFIQQQNREANSNSSGSNDSSMDMHAD